MAFGLSFDPSASQQAGPGSPVQTGARPGGSPIQQAIQYLSLRIPKVQGAQAPVDPRLLAGSPQAAQTPSPRVNAVVESVLRSVLGPEHAAVSAPMVPPVLAAPAPGSAPPAPIVPSAAPAPTFHFDELSPLPPPGPVSMRLKHEPTKAAPAPMMGASGLPVAAPAPVSSAVGPSPAPRFTFGPPAQSEERAALPENFPQDGLMAIIKQLASANPSGFAGRFHRTD